jgi:hypothetical protein
LIQGEIVVFASIRILEHWNMRPFGEGNMKRFKYWQSLPIQHNTTKVLVKGRLPCPGDLDDINPLLIDFVFKWTRYGPGESIYKHRYMEHLRDIITPAMHGPWRSWTQEDFAGPGHLRIVLERRECGDQMERWYDSGRSVEYSITAGVYIHAQATSILKRPEENRIVGLITDTTGMLCDNMSPRS